MPPLTSQISPASDAFRDNAERMKVLVADISAKAAKVERGGSNEARERHVSRIRNASCWVTQDRRRQYDPRVSTDHIPRMNTCAEHGSACSALAIWCCHQKSTP